MQQGIQRRPAAGHCLCRGSTACSASIPLTSTEACCTLYHRQHVGRPGLVVPLAAPCPCVLYAPTGPHPTPVLLCPACPCVACRPKTFKAWLLTQETDYSPEEAQVAYDAYLAQHFGSELRASFERQRHKAT